MKKDKRFVNIKALQKLYKQRGEINNKINSVNPNHCCICGDTEPKHGFYPLWGMAVGPGIQQTSGLLCNGCEHTDEEYLKTFKEFKEKKL